MATHNSYYEAQLLIDKEIADLTARVQHEIRLLKARRNDSIRLLKTHRNELAPASKLPEEILLHIFLTYRDSTDLHPKNWHKVAHICRYWRDVAIGSPSLWTRLYNPWHALTSLMLERSQNAPLDVSFSGRRSKISTETLTIILHEIERIQKLAFAAMPPTILNTFHDVLANVGRDWEASLLESLSVNMNVSPGPHSAGVKLAMDVFRPTRRLRRLSLTAVYYDWGMLPIPGLTHLHLYGHALGEVSGGQFTEGLRQMQSLEVLEINWKKLNLRQYPPTPRPEPIHLPCLRKLEIVQGYQDHFDSFLSLMTHPTLHQLSIVSPCSVNNLVTFIRSLVSSLEKGNFSPLEYVMIEFEYFTLSARHWSSCTLGSLIHMYVPYDGNGRDFKFVADIMSCITPFDNPDMIPLRHLCLANWGAPVDQFTRLFASLQHLETIEVYHKLALVLFKALNMAAATPSTPVPFPILRSIIWNSRRCPVLTLSSDVFNELYDSLLSRHVQLESAAMIRLELVGCGRMDDNQASQLEEIGVEVVVREND